MKIFILIFTTSLLMLSHCGDKDRSALPAEEQARMEQKEAQLKAEAQAAEQAGTTNPAPVCEEQNRLKMSFFKNKKQFD